MKSVLFGIFVLLTVSFGFESVMAQSTTTEGVSLIGADTLNQEGYTGDGVKVAIFGDGFDINNPEISNNISSYMTFGNTITNTDVGTAAAEVVLDFAPDVELYLYATTTDNNFSEAMTDMINNDIDIVLITTVRYNDAGPLDGTSFLSQQANVARDNGILWVSPAGDSAERHWKGQFMEYDSVGRHVFESSFGRISSSLQFDVAAGETFRTIVSWDDWDRTGQEFGEEYDAYLYTRTLVDGNIVGSGMAIYPEPMDQYFELLPPFEILQYTPDVDSRTGVTIYKPYPLVTPRDANMHVFSQTHDIHDIFFGVPESSILIPGESEGSFTVGATNVVDDSTESFSSQGPTDDGRIKPDVMAPNRVTTTSLDPFVGTVASASHIAGTAVLIKEKFPDATADQIQTMIELTTDDYHQKTNDGGTGRVDLSMFSGSDILALNIDDRNCNPCFYPEDVTISAGDTITWVNAGENPITITVDGKTGTMSRGETFSATFNADGAFEYSDSRYSWASGTISVGNQEPIIPPVVPPTILSATLSAPNQITATFSEPVNVAVADFANLVISGESVARTITSVSTSATTTPVITFDGDPTTTDATATLDIGNGITNLDGTNFNGVVNMSVSDGQAPVFVSVTIESNTGTATVGDIVTLEFVSSEEITTSTVEINGNSHQATSSGNTWTASRTIDSTDPVGAISFEIRGFSDTSQNSGTTVTSTTDGSSVLVTEVTVPSNETVVTGTVFSDTNWNGVQDPGEVGIYNYRMLAIDYSEPNNIMDTYTDSNGAYSFEVTPGAITLVQTWYHPPGHVVFDQNTSWFTYAMPEENETVEFNVGFHPVTIEERVTLEIIVYNDTNFNRVMDPGEPPVTDSSGLYVYTYTIGPATGLISTDSGGTATITDLVPADFAVLIYKDPNKEENDLLESGWQWAGTTYERSDLESYDETSPVSKAPDPGSRHTMNIGLWPR